MKLYKYGMRLRGFSIGCQPMNGFFGRKDDNTGKYYDILFYEIKLPLSTTRDYELDYLGEAEYCDFYESTGGR